VKLFSKPLGAEAIKYLVVGAGGYLIDVGIFNLISLSRLSGALEIGPISAKVISFLVAVTFTYIANSRWTFNQRTGRPEGLNRISRYAAVNVVGLVITVLPLYISRYVLGLDSLLADNISANLIGVVLALIFRFFANRSFVFSKAN
jgi:putative flippase GtrA